MKNSKTYWNGKNQKVEIWFDQYGKQIDYWKKINGVTYPISKTVYENICNLLAL